MKIIKNSEDVLAAQARSRIDESTMSKFKTAYEDFPG